MVVKKKSTSRSKSTRSKKSTSKSRSMKSKSTSRTKSAKKTKSTGKRKYSKSAQEDVRKEMHAYKKGTAHSGPKLKPVKSRKQAIAIGLSKARKKGKKVPKKK